MCNPLYNLNFQKSLANGSISLQQAIQGLSEHILHFEDAKLFKKHLSNILLAIVSSKIHLKSVFSNADYQNCTDSEKWAHLEFCITLALLSDHPDVMQ